MVSVHCGCTVLCSAHSPGFGHTSRWFGAWFSSCAMQPCMSQKAWRRLTSAKTAKTALLFDLLHPIPSDDMSLPTHYEKITMRTTGGLSMRSNRHLMGWQWHVQLFEPSHLSQSHLLDLEPNKVRAMAMWGACISPTAS